MSDTSAPADLHDDGTPVNLAGATPVPDPAGAPVVPVEAPAHVVAPDLTPAPEPAPAAPVAADPAPGAVVSSDPAPAPVPAPPAPPLAAGGGLTDEQAAQLARIDAFVAELEQLLPKLHAIGEAFEAGGIGGIVGALMAGR